MKCEFNHLFNCWTIDGCPVPNWKPDDVAFKKNYEGHYNGIYYNIKTPDFTDGNISCKSYEDLMIEQGRILIKMMQDKYKKKEKSMLDENQQKIVIKQFQEKLKYLLSLKENRVNQMAVLGQSLNDLIVQIKEVNEVLDHLQPCENCDCDD